MRRPAALFGAFAVLATSMPVVVISTYATTAQAQTQGMQRRGERRDTRQASRDVKHACNASTDASRAECRQTKREVKQAGRHD